MVVLPRLSGLLPPCWCAGRAAAVVRHLSVSLQAFRVPGKGWGARCAVDLPAGAVLCTYI